MAFSITTLKIRQQTLLLTLPVMLLLFAAIGLLLNTFWTEQRMDLAARGSAESVGKGEALLRQLSVVELSVTGYTLTRQAPFLNAYNDAKKELPEDLAALSELAAQNTPRRAEVEAIRTALENWQAELARPAMTGMVRGGQTPNPQALDASQKSVEAIRAQVRKLIDENVEANLALAQQSEHQVRRVLVESMGLGVLVAVALIALSHLLSALMARPVMQLIDASTRVGRGDFAATLPPPTDNEFGVLSRSFSQMTQTLRHDREDLAALNRFSEAVTQCTIETEVHDQLLFSLRERFAPNQVIVFKLSPAENFLEAAASLHPLPEKHRSWPVIDEPHNCKAVRTGRRFRLNDVTQEPLCPSKFAPPAEGSYYCSPLIAGGILIGAVRLEGMKDFWTPERESLLESYLSGAAAALSNLRLLGTMKKQANVDELTGLYNRRFLEDYARKLIAMADRRSMPVGLIMLDLDHFKDYNDTFGHDGGDRVLRQFSKTMVQAMRETNLAARYGGEEFVVLLPDTDAPSAMLVAERIRHAVAHMRMLSATGQALPPVTVSSGVAVYPDHGRTLDELLAASDKALYESKRGGRNRSTLYVEATETAG